MCTLTWLHAENGYELFFNRDEMRTRPHADSPVVKTRNHIRHIAPTDSAGGTWMGVNEYGLSVCILNHHPVPMPLDSGKMKSRGMLVDSLLGEVSREAVGRRMGEEPLHDYRPFILVAVDADMSITTFTWEGARLEAAVRDAAQMPLTTSSYDSAEVITCRRLTFERLVGARATVTADLLISFHCQRDPEAGAYSVCMERDDAHTVSFSHIRVSPDQVCFAYTPHAPCVPSYAPGARLVLARRAAP